MLQALELSQATRLINHGPVVMVSAKAGGVGNALLYSYDQLLVCRAAELPRKCAGLCPRACNGGAG